MFVWLRFAVRHTKHSLWFIHSTHTRRTVHTTCGTLISFPWNHMNNRILCDHIRYVVSTNICRNNNGLAHPHKHKHNIVIIATNCYKYKVCSGDTFAIAPLIPWNRNLMLRSNAKEKNGVFQITSMSELRHGASDASSMCISTAFDVEKVKHFPFPWLCRFCHIHLLEYNRDFLFKRADIGILYSNLLIRRCCCHCSLLMNLKVGDVGK